MTIVHLRRTQIDDDFFLLNLEPDIIIGNYHRLCELLDNNLINLKNVSFLVMDDFYRNRSARLSDEIKRVVNETRVSILIPALIRFFSVRLSYPILPIIVVPTLIIFLEVSSNLLFSVVIWPSLSRKEADNLS